MNELIEKLWVEHNTGMYTGFKQAIQTACKAQRNACARIYNKHYGNSEHYDECCGLEIFTAEIERCNYGNFRNDKNRQKRSNPTSRFFKRVYRGCEL